VRDLIKISAVNFLAVVALFSLIAAPIYFAQNFAHVAGVKTQSQYLLVSQVEKFPGMTFSQGQDSYTLSFTKLAQSQAYLSVIILNNPTNESKTYTIKNQSPQSHFFFGDNLNSQKTKVSVPSQSTVSISLMSQSDNNSQSASFQIQVN